MFKNYFKLKKSKGKKPLKQTDLNLSGCPLHLNNIVGSVTQAATAVTVALLTFKIIDDTFGF